MKNVSCGVKLAHAITPFWLLDDMPHSVFAAQLLLPEEPLVVEALVSGESAGRDDDHLPAGDVIAHHLNYAVPRYVREVVVAQVLEGKKEINSTSTILVKSVILLIKESAMCSSVKDSEMEGVKNELENLRKMIEEEKRNRIEMQGAMQQLARLGDGVEKMLICSLKF